jgi:HK97 family phage portal protein
MIGTYRPNLFHRLGDAWSALKGVPIQPGALYPPPQQNRSSGWINWEGWPAFEKQGQNENQRDLARARVAVTSPWVFADIQAIANEFSTAELIVKERRGDKLEDVDNHPLELVWQSPNEHMGINLVMAFWAWSYVLSSKAYLYWVPDLTGTSIMEVWPIPPWMIQPIPDKDQFIRGYAFKSSQYGDSILIPPELITYSHSVNLFDLRDGMSFLVAADTEIKADIAASIWNLNFFDENNGVPDGLIGLDPAALDQDVERVRMELRDFFGGTKRGIAVARSNDLKYQPFGRTQKDMEFGAGREFASKVIGRTLGFPDGYWSDLANRANAEQARRTMISGAVWPLLVRLAEDMNAKRRGIVQRWYGEDFRVEFRDIRPEDKESKRAELQAYQPFVTINELREMIGQEPLDDVRGLMLVAEITKGAPLPGTPAAQELEDLQAEKDEAAAQEAAAAVESGEAEMPEEEAALDENGEPLPDDIAPEEAAPMEEEMPMKAIDDLALWERKALKSFKRFRKADVAFETNAIPLPDQVEIHAALKAADSPDAIKAAFRGVDALLASVDADARRWVEV